MKILSFDYMGIPVEYRLIRKKVKNINIKINEECVITVSASEGVPLKKITDFVESKAEWIMRNMASIERYNLSKPDENIYIGKKVYLLGKSYIVDIRLSDQEDVEVDGSDIIIYSKDPDNQEDLKRVYLKFLKSAAEEVFEMILNKEYEIMKEEGISLPKFSVRNMKTRWGSCNPRACSITLNLQLIKTDMACIREVVCHELTHLKVSNHSAQFYEILEKYVPEWKRLKEDMDTKYKDGI